MEEWDGRERRRGRGGGREEATYAGRAKDFSPCATLLQADVNMVDDGVVAVCCVCRVRVRWEMEMDLGGG